MFNTISLDLTAEQTVVNDTIKVIATVEAAISPGQSDAELRAGIRTALKDLIESAEWQFSNLRRSTDSAGLERVSLTASVRVNETENANLDGRARAVSRPGLTISRVEVDNTIPQHRVEEAEQELRLTLLKKAKDEVARVNEVLGVEGQQYTIHRVEFGGPVAPMAPKGMRVMAATATLETASYGGGGDALGNAQKFRMTASVVFGVEG